MFSLIDAITKDVEIKNIQLIDRLCFLIDVKKQIFKFYKLPDFKHCNSEGLNGKELEKLCFYLMKSYPEAGHKVVNTLLKVESGILKNTPKEFVFPKSISDFIKESIKSIALPNIKVKEKKLVNVFDWVKDFKKDSNKELVCKTLDFTFVKWNGPVEKAYSYTLFQNKLNPVSIINVQPRLSLKKKIFNILPFILRNQIAKILFANQIMKPCINTGNVDVFNSSCELKKVFESLNENMTPFGGAKTVGVSNINDVQIVNLMRNQLGSIVLFSGGGIIRKKTFDLVGKRFLHIHPGLLPAVRGADGFFWSILLNGYPSCTAIYQNTGIDTGEILYEVSFEVPKFDEKVVESLKKTNTHENFYEIIYRSILNYYDPVMRAATLSGVLNKIFNGDDICTFRGREQLHNDGRDYHFMHPTLRNKLIDLLLKR